MQPDGIDDAAIAAAIGRRAIAQRRGKFGWTRHLAGKSESDLADQPPSAVVVAGKARTLARQRILAGCATTTPAALGTPCDAGASSLAELADCVLDRQLVSVSEAAAGEVAAPCGLLDLAGLGGAFPAMCE